MKNTKKLLYYLKYLLSCLTILPIVKYFKWTKQIKNANSLIKEMIDNIVLFCQTYRTRIAKIFTFFNKKNKNNYINLVLRKFLVFEINISTFKDFLILNEHFNVVITKFLKIKQKTLEAYQQESNTFQDQMNFYTKTINSFLGEIKFNFKVWPKKFLKKIYLQIDHV